MKQKDCYTQKVELINKIVSMLVYKTRITTDLIKQIQALKTENQLCGDCGCILEDDEIDQERCDDCIEKEEIGNEYGY